MIDKRVLLAFAAGACSAFVFHVFHPPGLEPMPDHATVATMRTASGSTSIRPPAVEPPATGDSFAVPHDGRRNIFAFEEKPSGVIAPRLRPEAKVATEVPAALPVSVVDHPQPRQEAFPYRFVGRFGHDAKPIAVFTRQGEVVNSQVGEAVGGAFTLTAIGVESVELSSVSGEVRRVPLQP